MDARAGLVGEDQLAWISEAVEESSRTWKVSWVGQWANGRVSAFPTALAVVGVVFCAWKWGREL